MWQSGKRVAIRGSYASSFCTPGSKAKCALIRAERHLQNCRVSSSCVETAKNTKVQKGPVVAKTLEWLEKRGGNMGVTADNLRHPVSSTRVWLGNLRHRPTACPQFR